MHALQNVLRSQSDPERAALLARFFKTGPGEYGEGDRFLGLTVPAVRRSIRPFRETDLESIDAILASPYHEERLAALLLLVQRYERGDENTRAAVYDLYLGRTDRINNWDLVDVSAPRIVGAHLESRNRRVLRRLAKSPDLWERRIAMISTLWFIARRDFADALAIATLLLGDRHDLIHKASGWMLREIGKREAGALEEFLDAHAPAMPRTMLRYSIERLPPARRRHYLER